MATGLFVGLVTIDIFNIVDHHPHPNEKVKAQHQTFSAGGPAANAAVAFGAFGNNAHLVSGLGCHPIAALASSDLTDHRVMVYDHAADPGALPIISSIIVNSSSGDRSVVYSEPHGRSLTPEYPCVQIVQAIEKCSVILFDGFYLPQALAVAKAVAGRIPVVLDGGSWKAGLEELLPYVDYAICSNDFKAPGCAKQQDLLDYLIDLGIHGCAISRGPEPIVYRQSTEQGQLEVPRVDAIDTLGAGDILHGAFCHHILTNSFEKSLELAAQSASISCRYYGTREWINHL